MPDLSTETSILLTERQFIYALEYILSHDPIQAYVRAGYAKTIEEAKARKNYTQPLKTKAIQKYLNKVRSTKGLPIKQLRLSQMIKEKELKSKPIEIPNYDDDSSFGMDISRFLKDVIYSPKYHMKERLKALEMLMKFKGNDLEKEEVPNIINVFRSELNETKDKKK